MTKESLVSIVTPVYNGARFIEETIDSVVAQTYTNWEWFIIDDGSVDDTAELVLKRRDERLHFITIPHSGLPAVARNVGLGKAHGEYIAFLDADDLWEREKLATQVKAMELDKTLLFTSSRFSFYPSTSPQGRATFRNRRLSFRGLISHYIVANSSVIMRKSVRDTVGYLDEDPYLRAVEDFDYWLRILDYQDNSCLIQKEVLMKYRLHEANISTLPDKTTLNWLDKVFIIFEKYQSKRPRDVKLAKKIAEAVFKRSHLKQDLYEKRINCFQALLSFEYDLRTKASIISDSFISKVRKENSK